MHKSLKKLVLYSIALLIIGGLGVYMYLGTTKHEEEIELPYTMHIDEHDQQKKKTIAYRFWFDYMHHLQETNQLTYASFTRFHMLEDKGDAFTVAVVFQVEIGEHGSGITWGDVTPEGTIENIVWKMSIEKEAPETCTLTDIEQSSDPHIGLPPLEKPPHTDEEERVPQDAMYELTEDTLRITYNNGKDWLSVPVEIEELFDGEYNGDRTALIDGSYLIDEDHTAFIIGGENNLRLLQTTNQGDSWQDSTITSSFPRVRMRLLGFTSTSDGYVIVSGDRTMSSEGHYVYTTDDGGASWQDAGNVAETERLIEDGGFITKDIGFISFGAEQYADNPPRPALYRTADNGIQWEKVHIPIPEEFQGIFTMATIPTIENDEWTLIVHQGPDGDYVGGNVQAKFISQDKGKTWTFTSLIDPDGHLINE